jgi:peptidoglycan/LPS O-acetylase OafA/YrhL
VDEVSMTVTLILITLYVLSITLFCLATQRLPILSRDALHRVSSLDGLRGVLATAVIVHHFIVSYYWHVNGVWETTDSRVLNNMGTVPVSLFFMITGYLFTAKVYRSEPKWRQILSSRVRRIFPMYLFSVALITAIALYQSAGVSAPIMETLKALGRWVIFIGSPINGFPETVRVNASVQWTLLYEAVFYLSLPVLYCLLRRRLPGLAVAVALITLACLWGEYHHHFHNRFIKLFAVGIAVAVFEERMRQWRIDFKGVRCTLAAIAILLICMKLKSYSTLQMLILGIPFALFVLGNSLHGVLEVRGLKILGEASFSIYLLHGIVIYSLFSLLNVYDFASSDTVSYLLYLPLIILLTSSLSVATYWCIEHPFLRKSTPGAQPERQRL